MAREAKTKVIDGHGYTVSMMPAEEAQDLLVDIAGILGPALGAAAGGMANLGDVAAAMEKELSDVNGNVAGNVVSALTKALDKKKLREITAVLAKHTQVEGLGILSNVYSLHFAGRMGVLVQWLIFAVGVQFEDFFASLGGAVAAVRPPKSAVQAEA